MLALIFAFPDLGSLVAFNAVLSTGIAAFRTLLFFRCETLFLSLAHPRLSRKLTNH